MNTTSQQQTCHHPTSEHNSIFDNDQICYSNSHESTVITRSPSHDINISSNNIFSKFLLLPLELREEIWSLCTLPGPRLIEVYAERSLCITQSNSSKSTSELSTCHTVKGSSQCSHPKIGQFFTSNPHRFPLLSVSQESRRIALKTFSFCFSQFSSPGILFQPNIDTVYFRSENQLILTNVLLDAQTSSKLNMDNVKSFAFDTWEDRYGDNGGPQNFFPFLHKCPNPMLSGLKNLFIIRIPVSNENAEGQEIARWILCIKSTLTALQNDLNPSIEVVRKSKLWDGKNKIPWVDTPHWKSRMRVEATRETLKERVAALGERARIPLYSYEQQALDAAAEVKNELGKF